MTTEDGRRQAGAARDQSAREVRAAAALRENLRKRKEQQRGRSATQPPETAETPAAKPSGDDPAP